MNNFLTSLCKFINNPEEKSINYQIAYTILENCQNIENMTIKNLAEKCYVSPATIIRFLEIYGLKKYAIFKTILMQHINLRKNQMLNRLKEKKYNELDCIIEKIFSKNERELIQDIILECCQLIKESHRIVLIGSDEMIAYALRMQVDFCVMGKLVIVHSIYPEKMVYPDKEDFIILFSMSGRIIDLSNHLIDYITHHHSSILTISYYQYIDEAKSLLIPKNHDEVIENMILDYFLQELVYTYMRNYYDC